MKTTRELGIGDEARDFTLKNHRNEDFTLSHFKGKRVLLSFHPLAWTGICEQQMRSLEANWKIFSSYNALAVGISIDSVPSKLAWAKQLGIKKTLLLSDFWPHGKVAQDYGLFRKEDGFSERANVIIDENQRIAFIKIYPLQILPDVTEIIEFLKK